MRTPRCSFALSLALALATAGAAQEEEPVAHLFGKGVSEGELRDAMALDATGGADQALRMLALDVHARGLRLRADPKAVAESVADRLKLRHAQSVAMEEVEKRQVALESPEGRRLYQQLYFRAALGKGPTQKQREAIAKQLHSRGHAGLIQVEARDQRVSLLMDKLRKSVLVTDQDVRTEYDARFERRAFDLYPLKVADYLPRADAAPGSPGHVSEDDLQIHYARGDYSAPRRVALEVVVGAVAGAGATRTAALAKLDTLFDGIARTLESDRRAARRSDFATLAATSPLLKFVKVPLSTQEELASRPLIGGPALCVHARRKPLGACSDVLASEEAWFVARTSELQPLRPRTFAEARAQVLADYLKPSLLECRASWRPSKASPTFDEASARRQLLARRAEIRATLRAPALLKRLRGLEAGARLKALQSLAEPPTRHVMHATQPTSDTKLDDARTLAFRLQPGEWATLSHQPGVVHFVQTQPALPPTADQAATVRAQLVADRGSEKVRREFVRLLFKAKSLGETHERAAMSVRGGKRRLTRLRAQTAWLETPTPEARDGAKARAKAALRAIQAGASFERATSFAAPAERVVPYFGPRCRPALAKPDAVPTAQAVEGGFEVAVAAPWRSGELALFHVVVSSKEEAEQIRQLLEGRDQREALCLAAGRLAEEHSIAPTKAKAGALGMVSVEDVSLSLELSAALDAGAKPGRTWIAEMPGAIVVVRFVAVEDPDSAEEVHAWRSSLFEGAYWN